MAPEEREAVEAAMARRESTNRKDLCVIRAGERWAYVLQWFVTETGWDFPRVVAKIRVEPAA